MRILGSDQIQLSPLDRRYCMSKVKAAVFLAVFSIFTGIPLFFLTGTVQVISGALWLLFFLFLLRRIICRLKSGAWIAAVCGNSLLFKSRVYESDMPCIVELMFSDITSARCLSERYVTYKLKKNRIQTKFVRSVQLELQLIPTVYHQFRSAQRIQYVEFKDDYRVGLHLSALWIDPKHILSDLSVHCNIQPNELIRYPIPDLQHRHQIDDYIRFLVNKNDINGACCLARKAFGLPQDAAEEYAAGCLKPL